MVSGAPIQPYTRGVHSSPCTTINGQEPDLRALRLSSAGRLRQLDRAKGSEKLLGLAHLDPPKSMGQNATFRTKSTQKSGHIPCPTISIIILNWYMDHTRLKGCFVLKVLIPAWETTMPKPAKTTSQSSSCPLVWSP